MPTPGHSSNTRTDLLNALVALEGLTRESILAASDAEQPFAAGAEPERCCEACCLKRGRTPCGCGTQSARYDRNQKVEFPLARIADWVN